MISVPLLNGSSIVNGYYLGMFVVVLHSINGGMFSSLHMTCVTKNLSKELFSIGAGLVYTFNNLSICLGPMVTGAIMGKEANADSINKCCLFLAGVAFAGAVFNLLLVKTDKEFESDKKK